MGASKIALMGGRIRLHFSRYSFPRNLINFKLIIYTYLKNRLKFCTFKLKLIRINQFNYLFILNSNQNFCTTL